MIKNTYSYKFLNYWLWAINHLTNIITYLPEMKIYWRHPSAVQGGKCIAKKRNDTAGKNGQKTASLFVFHIFLNEKQKKEEKKR